MKLGFPHEKMVNMGAFNDVYVAHPEDGLITFVWKSVYAEQTDFLRVIILVMLTEFDETLLELEDKRLLPEVMFQLSRGIRRVNLRGTAEDELTVLLKIQELIQNYHQGNRTNPPNEEAP